MWDGYREGISALALLVRVSDSYYDGPDGLRTAWLESAAGRIPQGDPSKDPPGRHTCRNPRRGGRRTPGSRERPRPPHGFWPETGNFFLDHNYEDG